MNPTQPTQTAAAPTHRKKLTGRTKAALWLLLGPTLLAIASLTIFALINLVFNPTFWPTPDTENFAETPLIITVINIFLFVIGSISIASWLPGLIIGAVLLIKRPKNAAVS